MLTADDWNQRLLDDYSSILQFVKTVVDQFPKNVKESIWFKDADNIKGSSQYEEVIWIINDANIPLDVSSLVQEISSWKCDDHLTGYIRRVILGDYEICDKLVLLLSHFEAFLLYVFPDVSHDDIKNQFKGYLENNSDMNSYCYNFIYVYAIVNVVYANTKNTTNMDRRLPHRNDILHKGIIEYSIDEIKCAYFILLGYFCFVERKFISGRYWGLTES